MDDLEDLQNEFTDFYEEVHGVKHQLENSPGWNSVEWLKQEIKHLCAEAEVKGVKNAFREFDAIADAELEWHQNNIGEINEF